MPIVPNHVKQRLAKDELALGFGVHHLRGAAVGMLAASAGFDWLFIDMEHGATSVHEATQIAIAALNQGVTPIVRVCKDAVFEGTRALDNGAMGVVVPHVDNAEEAKAVADAYRFPPVGTRSWGGPPFAYNFKPPAVAEAQVELNREILVTVMIETPEAVANAAAIAAVPGIDALMIGTSDLTASMGIAGQIGHERVQAAYKTVADACKSSGKVLGMGGVYDETWAAAYIKLGARLLLSGSDHNLLLAGATARSKFLRGLQG
ncbi:aldolase/citrate lyase family protein [Siccirubricoccus sp. KC 17139]|uniref:Aldolase/citrate lyase family protein n=1 Tax=Siccirubricoccus soli TaxID=2899147 RepID=A0ABT1D3G5_9PROT|nr:aldolase/citrate lyase family protein [Siccirubricoccus soli]MCO6415530.1 aldolase/citrate lyase family protein [Siccirubricoccus soli]MCP2681662.1 aldolase/citrate lyase family protein [Siccirubricoccus soli]